MTKADLYKRRSKNKQRKSSGSEPAPARAGRSDDEAGAEEVSLVETINNLKNRMHNSSIDKDVELIKANGRDSPAPDPASPEEEDIPPVGPVEKTYAKARSKLDDYIYIESRRGLDETEVAFPRGGRAKRAKVSRSPVPRKRRKIEANGDRQSRSGDDGVADAPTERRALRSGSERERDEKRPANESIENDKAAVARNTRKRKREDAAKPVLREKGQNGHQAAAGAHAPRAPHATLATRKITRAKKTKSSLAPLQLDIDRNVRMTRSRTRRLEISLSPSQVKSVVPAFSFESDRRMNSIESDRSAKSNNTRAKARNARALKNASGAKKPPVRATRARAGRR
ncbi:unnamed protein product [Diatraea saccharalis]|uniref:Uncharacterized protein n=1 Tax=Diatraea saccharalis TaxID=40085 RepID=A0A9P0FYQ9_9NEOP|nr:unnamed protein product [Diatraea saccharalis]